MEILKCKFQDQLTRLIVGFLIRGFAMAAMILLTIDDLKAAGKDPVLARAEISPDSSVELSANGLSIKAKRKETKDGWSISVSGKSANGPFSFYYRFRGVSDYTQYILIVELDPKNSSPEIMFRAYTGGAHCCSLPVFAYEIGRGMWKKKLTP